MIMQIIMTLVLLSGVSLGCLIFYNKRKNQEVDDITYVSLSLDYLVDLVKRRVIEITKEDDIISIDNARYKVNRRNVERINRALTQCVDGIKSSKDVVIALIRDIIKVEVDGVKACNEVLDFDNLELLPPMIKFEILVYLLSEKFGDEVIKYLNEKYNFTMLRTIQTELWGKKKKREVDYQLVDYMFLNEIFQNKDIMNNFGYEQYLDILSILVYQKYTGFGCVDTIRGLAIDGFNFGTSGSIRYDIEGNWDAPYKTTNSVWIQIDAQWVHFSFIDFGTKDEMKRLTRQLTQYGNVAPMTQRNPHAVKDAPDGARITAIAPDSGECWACFVRKFNVTAPSMQSLLDKPYAKNYELVSQLLYFMAKAKFSIPFTGQQNTGKTTLMKAFIEYCDLNNIRILEMSFELALREIYTWMNIFTAKPTAYITNNDIQNIFKKTDSTMTMIGEIAEDDIVPNMVQFRLTNNNQMSFSHHGKDDEGLVDALTDSYIFTRKNVSREAAMFNILQCIMCNCHLDFVEGNRVVAYISEIIAENRLKPYPVVNPSKSIIEAIDQNTYMNKTYYERQTDRSAFTSRKIIEYNPKTQSYEAVGWFTEETTKIMLSKLGPSDKVAFLKFFNANFKSVVKSKTEEKKVG